MLTVEQEPCETASPSIERPLTAKEQWVIDLRLKFCTHPNESLEVPLLKPNGMLNQAYFRPASGTIISSEDQQPAWTETEDCLLLTGLSTLGVGRFKDISEKHLPNCDPQELRLRTARLLGRQNLGLYKGRTLSAKEIQDEHAKNKEIGLALGQWKGGMLVYDDGGRVLERLLQDTDAKELQDNEMSLDTRKRSRRDVEEQ